MSTKVDVARVIERLDKLTNQGEVIRHTAKFPGIPDFFSRRPVRMIVDSGGFAQWRVGCLSLLNSILGAGDIYLLEFQELCKGAYIDDTEKGLGVLRALRDDIEDGYLQKVETLVSAKVFSDFLEMAEHILDNGYKDPAASLTGAVLEDGLRRICSNNNIPVKSDDMSSLNQKLAAKKVYNRLQQKQIQVWNDIRNNADHGHFDQYKSDDVTDMLKGVRSFLADYLK